MNNKILSIKTKKFGVRLAAFRQKRGATTEVLSQWTGISNEKIQAIEQGKSAVTLPELELMAIKLGFSTEMLINGDLKELTASSSDNVSEQQYTSLRDRIVALILRKTRMEQDKSLETIAAQCELEPEELEQFENGSNPVPLPTLELLCAEYQIPVLSLTSQKPSSKPSPSAEVTSTQSIENLPEEVAEFVNNPANLPYLELARKLSDLDAAKLRSIAEGLLEITY